MKPTLKKPLKIGLDLDGVILYNPARMARPIAVAVKKLFFKDKVSTFFIPHSPIKKYIWYLLHKSSLFIAPGFADFKRLAAEKKVKLYVISGRYSFLHDDLEKWIKKLGGLSVIAGYYHNIEDEQPYRFKEKMIEKLELDVYIEDNWDIVKYLGRKDRRTKIFWLSNPLDLRIPYLYKFFSLGAIARFIRKMLL